MTSPVSRRLHRCRHHRSHPRRGHRFRRAPHAGRRPHRAACQPRRVPRLGDFHPVGRLDQRVSKSGLTSSENTSSEPLCEFWHGTRMDLSLTIEDWGERLVSIMFRIPTSISGYSWPLSRTYRPAWWLGPLQRAARGPLWAPGWPPQKPHKCGSRRLPPQESHGQNGTVRHTAARLLAWADQPMTSLYAGEAG